MLHAKCGQVSEHELFYYLVAGHDWNTQGSNKFKSKSLGKITPALYNDIYGYYSLFR